jgi:hypothetical protein
MSSSIFPKKKDRTLENWDSVFGLQSVESKDSHTLSKKTDRRKLPLLKLYEFQTLTEYATQNLIFDSNIRLVCTRVEDLYNDYLHFFYETRFTKKQSFQAFEKRVKQKQVKRGDSIPGLTTRYQFSRALQFVAQEKFNVKLEKKNLNI